MVPRLKHPLLKPQPTIEWRRESAAIDYGIALDVMRERGDAIARGDADELVWLLEHEPIYTAGTSTRAEHVPNIAGVPVISVERGGSVTYHGPGQLITYTLLDVRRRADGDVRAFVTLLETWVIGALDRLGVAAFVAPDRPGVWVEDAAVAMGQSKIAALGLRVRQGVSRHGVSINIDPDLAAFDRIVPCGLAGFGVTSLARLGRSTNLAEVDAALEESLRASIPGVALSKS